MANNSKHLGKLLLLLLLSVSLPTHAEPSEKTKEQLIQVYNDLSIRIQKCNGATDSVHFHQMCDSVEIIGKQIGSVNFILAASYFRISSVASNVTAQYYFERLKKLNDEYENEKHSQELVYNGWINLIVRYTDTSEYFKALEESQKMQKYALEKKNNYGIGQSYVAYGHCLKLAPKLAIENFKKALEYIPETETEGVLPYIYLSIMEKYSDIEDMKNALLYADKATKSDPENTYKSQIDILRLHAYTKLNNRAKADEIYNSLKKKFDNGDIEPFIIEGWYVYAAEYLIYIGEPEAAKEYIQKTTDSEIIYSLYSDYYRSLGQNEQALIYSDSLKTYLKNEFWKYASSQAEGANAMLNTNVLKAENQQMEIDREKNQSHLRLYSIIALAFFCFLAAYIAIISYRHSKRILNEQKRTEEQRLIAQDLYEQKTKLDAELNIAKHIQESMLPKFLSGDYASLITARMTPAKEVGGDFYNYVADGDYLYFVIADVSGKGVPAALFMSRATEIFYLSVKNELKAENIVKKINEQLCRDNDTNMFITLIVGILNTKTSELQLCNAGHNYPLHITESADIQMLNLPMNLPVGIMEDREFESQIIPFKKGERLVFYTDGVTEAENSEKELFGNDRLLSTVKLATSNTEDSETNRADICSAVENAVHAFAGNEPQSDDITIMTLYGDKAMPVVQSTKA